MKKILGIIVLGLLWCNVGFTEEFKAGQIVKDKFILSKENQVDLSPGDWVVVNDESWIGPITILIRTVGIVKVIDNEIAEVIELRVGDLTASYQGHINVALKEIIFKDKHDGCYSRPEYFLIEVYKKGNSFNCMLVNHADMNKMLYSPDNPELKAERRFYRQFIKSEKLVLPPIMLQSYHTYFSRLVGQYWYEQIHMINPKFFNGPELNFFTEETSEYHRLNIKKYPKFEKFMNEWVSRSSQAHISFEKNIKIRKKHKLSLSKYLLNVKKENNPSNDLVEQLNQLKKLMDEGILTKEEFKKAKKRLLNQ